MKLQARLGRRHRFFPGAHIAKGQNEFLASELDNEGTEPISQEDSLKRMENVQPGKAKAGCCSVAKSCPLFVSPCAAERQAPQSFAISQK